MQNSQKAQKTLLVTGASSGMGLRLCQLAGSNGFTKVIGVGRRLDALTKAGSGLEGQDVEFIPIAADLSEGKDAVDHIRNKVEKSCTKIDVLVNNAGVLHEKPIADVSWEDWKDSMRVNLASPYFLTQAMLPYLQKSGSPVVVNMSSTLASKPIPGTSIYNIAKAGLNMMTKTLALELAPKIRVNGIMPAVVDTPMFRGRFENEEKLKEAMPSVEGLHPLSRIGTVDDIANAVFFLSSEQSNWVTGVVLPVDGGMLTN